MKINMEGKICSEEECFYNEYINMYCIIGSTFSGDLSDLKNLFEDEKLLKMIKMPNYIKEDYDEPEW